MSDRQHHTHHPDNRLKEEDTHHPYWKRAHHDWKFWLAVSLMLTAMLLYITTLDLSVQPETQNPVKIGQQIP